MREGARRPFWLALTVSLLAHAAILTSPGWGLSDAAGDLAPARLDTRLVPAAAQQPAPLPAPQPKPRPRPHAAPSAVAPPAAATPVVPPEPAPLPEPVAIAPAAPEISPIESAVPPAPTFASVWPRAGRLVFKILRGDGLWVGQAEHRWQHDGERYELRAVTETIGLAALFHSASVVQSSQGILLPGGLQPLEFRTLRDGKLRETARIDPAQGVVYLGQREPVAVGGPVQDILSLFYQHGAVPDGVASYAITIATGRRIAEYQVSFEGAEQLDTPWGERAVRHLRMYTQTKNDSSEIWLDEITRLPFRIRYRDGKGEVFDQVIVTVELEQTP